MKVLSRLYKVRIIMWVYLVFINILIVLALIPLYIMHIVLPWNIKFYKLEDNRIGHMAYNTDLFVRRNIIEKKKNNFYVGFANKNPINKQLLRVLKRKLRIIQFPTLFYKIIILGLFHNNSLFLKTKFYQHLPCFGNEFKEFAKVPTQFSMTKEELQKGKKLLEKMKVKSWFICFHARDQSFLTKNDPHTNWDHHNFRNCDIRNYSKATKYISSKGGYSVRMGAAVERPLKDTNPKVVDYASKFRTDFGDIYLSGNCKFFLGSSSGLSGIAILFDVPMAYTNLIPLKFPPLRKFDIFIPKKIYSKKKKRLLTFKEIVNSEVFNYTDTQLYLDAGLEVIENIPQEIYDLAKEMNEKLDGTWKPHKNDEKLQKKFKSLFKPGSYAYGFTSRIGAKFLRENQELLK